MCGITGIIDSRIEQRAEAVRRMTDCIRHRGPDDDGYFADSHVALGMRRLSIIDLSRGKQPIASNGGRYLIFFNGEIYNYKEIKKELDGYEWKTDSDTEVVLAGFIKWGAEVVGRLRGMFAFAIYDTEEKKIFLARDFFGIKPLYYLKDGEKIMAFSSEIKSFLELPGFKREVNDNAVYNYLSFQYNPLDETFFKGVWKLPPARHLSIDLKTGKSEEKRYWRFKFNPDDSLEESKTRQKILSVMKDSVTHHMIADVPVGSFLSGGIDSSIIATLMQKIRGVNKIKTFTVGFKSISEGVEAKETADALGTDHTEISVGAKEYFEALPKAIWHFDEPVADPSALGLYFLAREARKSVKVVLSGEGADELFGGYNIYLEPFARRWISWLPRFALKFLSSLPLRGSNYAERALMRLEDWYIGNASVFKEREVKALWRGKPGETFSLKNIFSEVKWQSDSVRMQHIDINTWLVGDILSKADKMTMAHSLELRVPFLDIEVAKLAETLPDRFKWQKGRTKYLLREAFKSILPESTRWRKKLGFPVPIASWLNEEHFATILGNAYIQTHFNLDQIKKLFDQPKDNARKIYLLLALAIWYNTFIRQA
ncbi:MAG: asparagine synthase (glutamine-hydrolyzing) [bacterium]|nr:asparagine synthase (glutamine-hydrolyzing) [bacterium]